MSGGVLHIQKLQFNRSRLLVKMPRRRELSGALFDVLTKKTPEWKSVVSPLAAAID